MKLKRTAALILSLVLLAAALSGCGKTQSDPENTTAAPAQQTDTSAQQTTADPNKIDLGGYEFVLAGPSGREWTDDPKSALEEEMVEQYALVEEELNCTITCNPLENGNETLMQMCMSGDKLADFIRVRQTGWIPAAIANGIRPLESEEILAAGMNVYDADSFDQTLTQMSKVNGHIWTVSFAGKYDANFGHGYAFNKRLLAAKGYTDEYMYQLVRDFKWDWASFVSICHDISTDADGDGYHEIGGLNMLHGNELFTNKISMMYYDETAQRWKSGFATTEFQAALTYYLQLVQDPDMEMKRAGEFTNNDRRAAFYDGQAGFAVLYSSNFGEDGCNNRMIDDYGFLPFPHGPNAEYYASVVPDLDSWCMQYANDDWEKSCKVMSALGSRLTDYDELYKRLAAYFRDEQSMEMLTMYCFPHATFQITKASPMIEDAIDQAEMLLLTLGPAAALEQAELLMTNAINQLFGYKD